MTDPTPDLSGVPAPRLRARLERDRARLERYPRHAQAAALRARIKAAETELRRRSGPRVERPADRLLGRVDRLVVGVRKLRARMAAEQAPGKRARIAARIAEYQASLVNIRDQGTETPAPRPPGVDIEVPADVLSTGPAKEG
jgi:hypothetical protein